MNSLKPAEEDGHSRPCGVSGVVVKPKLIVFSAEAPQHFSTANKEKRKLISSIHTVGDQYGLSFLVVLLTADSPLRKSTMRTNGVFQYSFIGVPNICHGNILTKFTISRQRSVNCLSKYVSNLPIHLSGLQTLPLLKPPQLPQRTLNLIVFILR